MKFYHKLNEIDALEENVYYRLWQNGPQYAATEIEDLMDSSWNMQQVDCYRDLLQWAMQR